MKPLLQTLHQFWCIRRIWTLYGVMI